MGKSGRWQLSEWAGVQRGDYIDGPPSLQLGCGANHISRMAPPLVSSAPYKY